IRYFHVTGVQTCALPIFYTYFFNKGSSYVEAPMITIFPNVDSELLSNISVNRIGDYATYFNSNNKERSHNILLASEAINNQVVLDRKSVVRERALIWRVD